ncbi:MAG: hypothetical protein N3B15_08410, partial [Planctomycetota bacterium]|nr:hypothetical protein [Planctomycetota bacterium]
RSPADPAVITAVYGGTAPTNGTLGTAAILSTAIRRNLGTTAAAMTVTALDDNPAPQYPVFAK